MLSSIIFSTGVVDKGAILAVVAYFLLNAPCRAESCNGTSGRVRTELDVDWSKPPNTYRANVIELIIMWCEFSVDSEALVSLSQSESERMESLVRKTMTPCD